MHGVYYRHKDSVILIVYIYVFIVTREDNITVKEGKNIPVRGRKGP
jgi:hypothetical protein